MKVTKQELNRLQAYRIESELLRQEIIKVEDEISEYKASDIVKGSDTNYPYVMRTTVINGVDFDVKEANKQASKLTILKNRLKVKQLQCDNEYKRVFEYIYAVDDPLVRTILICKYIRKMTYQQTANALGGNNTADSVRMIHDRFLAEK